MSSTADPLNLAALTTQITVSYLRGQPVSSSLLPELIRSVHEALSQTGRERPTKEERPVPVVPVRRSVTPEAIICLECGKRNRMLKRHLRYEHDLTPDQYRSKWGLSLDYPMTAPNYAAQRSALAKANGLGHSRLGIRSSKPADAPSAPPAKTVPTKRTRKTGG